MRPLSGKHSLSEQPCKGLPGLRNQVYVPSKTQLFFYMDLRRNTDSTTWVGWWWERRQGSPWKCTRGKLFCQLPNTFLYQTHSSKKCPSLSVKAPDQLQAELGCISSSEKWETFQNSSKKRGVTSLRARRETLNALIQLLFSQAPSQNHGDGPFCRPRGSSAARRTGSIAILGHLLPGAQAVM